MSESFSSELVRRRIPHSLGIYLAGAWIAVEFSNWAEERYLLNPYLADVILVTLLCMLPAWLMFAWFHGAPGKDRWHRAEKIGIPINVMATVWILWAAFGGKEMSAVAQEITVTDELGSTQQVIVPTEVHQRTIGVFFWDHAESASTVAGSPEAHTWLQYGMPLMLGMDLEQDPYIRVLMPYSEFAQGIYRSLNRAGYRFGVNAPIPLMARIAANYSMDFFIAGRLSGDAQSGYMVNAELFQTTPTRSLEKFELSGNDPMQLTDDLSALISEVLDIPDISDALADDLQIRDHLTHSLEAVEQGVAGANAVLFDNDYAAAIAAWRQALQLDPAFALVARRLALANFLSGDTLGASEALKEALQHDYRLQESDRYVAKGLDYFIKGELDKRQRLFEMWVQLSPNNPDAHLALADVYVFAGNHYTEAIRELRIAAELMPSEARIYNGIGNVQLLAGQYEEAIASFERYMELRPDDPDGPESIGVAYERRGELEQARHYYEQAALVGDEQVEALASQMRVAYKRGDYVLAEQLFEEALTESTSPEELTVVLVPRLAMLLRQGRLEEELQAAEQLLEAARRFKSPIEILLGFQQPYTGALGRLGRSQEALDLFDASREQVGPPLDQFVAFLAAEVYLSAGDLDAAGEQIAIAHQVLEMMQQQHLLFILTGYEADLVLQQGDPSQAAELYASAAQEYRTGIVANSMPGGESFYLSRQARALRLAGAWDQMAAAIDATLAVDPANPLVLLQRAYLHWHRGDLELARADLAQVRNAWQDLHPRYRYRDEYLALRDILNGGSQEES